VSSPGLRLRISIYERRSKRLLRYSDWRLASAHAKVEQTRRADVPIGLDDAKVAAKALTRVQLSDIKKHPLVVKQFAKMTGVAQELL